MQRPSQGHGWSFSNSVYILLHGIILIIFGELKHISNLASWANAEYEITIFSYNNMYSQDSRWFSVYRQGNLI